MPIPSTQEAKAARLPQTQGLVYTLSSKPDKAIGWASDSKTNTKHEWTSDINMLLEKKTEQYTANTLVKMQTFLKREEKNK